MTEVCVGGEKESTLLPRLWGLFSRQVEVFLLGNVPRMRAVSHALREELCSLSHETEHCQLQAGAVPTPSKFCNGAGARAEEEREETMVVVMLMRARFPTCQ